MKYIKKYCIIVTVPKQREAGERDGITEKRFVHRTALEEQV